MLRIYPVCLEMVREVRPYADRVARFDRDLARQLRRASTAVPLNVAEGSGLRGGRRRMSYEIALGEAREALAGLETAEAIGYVSGIDWSVRARLDHVIGTLVKLVRLERISQPGRRVSDRHCSIFNDPISIGA
jgi:four helix bundle protein